MFYKNEEIVIKIIFLSEIEFSKKICESCIEQGKRFGVNIIPFKGVHGHKSEYLLKNFLKTKIFFQTGKKRCNWLCLFLLWLSV